MRSDSSSASLMSRRVRASLAVPGVHRAWRCLRHAAVMGLLALWLSSCGQEPARPADAAAQIEELLNANQTGPAARLVQESIARWPEDGRLRELQADLDFRQGRHHLAESAYRKALTLEPSRRSVAVKLARSALAQGHGQDALALAQPLDDDPAGVRAGLGLVRLLAQLDMPNPDLAALQADAQGLWRLVAEVPDEGPDNALDRAVMVELEQLAGRQPLVEAARQHVRCRTPEVLGRETGPSGPGAGGRILRVGPGRKLQRPSDAAAVAQDGDLVLMDAGTYSGDVSVWRQNRLTLRGDGGRARLQARGNIAEDKGIWVLKGDQTTVESVEFSGARSTHRNGSGIRLEGSGLVVRDALFDDNQMGILTSNNTPDSEILISHSEFRHNTSGSLEGELGHNIYIGRAGRFTLQFSYVHGAEHGHNVKSRARVNRILYNRIADEAGGRSSYLIDLPEGGQAEIIGNELHKGAFAENRPVIAYAAESDRQLHADSAVRVAYNTFYNVTFEGIGLKLNVQVPVMLANNVFAGAPLASVVGAPLAGNVETDRNTALALGGLVDGPAMDLGLTADSPAVDAATERSVSGLAMPVPGFEYVHPLKGRPRLEVWKRDHGAHEFCAQPVAAAAAP